ncbi:hypothetical protein T265_08238 [Opisthorchis viverrini]|uniref:Uncharacterized protein n=1 Tax=Opisthorchis viverrini TaxID=6198 RepID=A0A075A8Z8_OPIVI|nr:hypothetical protein T265_08238 [Opisthorchis viverrini]KER23994.1 hypothetical protein T265_08238 [Opisthorchis viverrini]
MVTQSCFQLVETKKIDFRADGEKPVQLTASVPEPANVRPESLLESAYATRVRATTVIVTQSVKSASTLSDYLNWTSAIECFSLDREFGRTT